LIEKTTAAAFLCLLVLLLRRSRTATVSGHGLQNEAIPHVAPSSKNESELRHETKLNRSEKIGNRVRNVLE
jgi:hypothetical protein